MQVVLLIATAGAALANWWSRLSSNDTVERWSKPLTTILVIALALVSGAPGSQIAVAVVALTLCLVGDVALMSIVDRFVLGLGAFLLGHLVFIVLFAQYGLTEPALAAVALLLVVILVATAGRTIVQGAADGDPALRIPVTAYLVVISSMAVCGWATGQAWVIAGTTLFVISDTVLGWGQFVRDRRWMSVVIMVTYHGAIASLALSLW